MKVYVLASGSKGNMTLIQTAESKFFVDAGITMSKIKKKMDDYNLGFSDIDTLYLTHEHSDHIAGLKGLLKLGYIKHVYLSKGTYEALSPDVTDLMINIHIIKADQSFIVSHYHVTTVMLSHDANEPIGYIFKDHEDKKVVVLTDTGYVDQSYDELLSDANLYILESNHDAGLLMKSSRPYHLKQRIIGVNGHLSNEDAVILMNRYVKKESVWVIAHMSEDCNTMFEVEKKIVELFYDPTLLSCHFASQESLEVIEI